MKPSTDFPTISGPRRVVLNVRSLMASRGVRSAAALHRMLITAGVDISNVQLLRIIDNKSTRLNMDVIDGLLNIFNCSVHDLFGEEAAAQSEDRIDRQLGTSRA